MTVCLCENLLSDSNICKQVIKTWIYYKYTCLVWSKVYEKPDWTFVLRRKSFEYLNWCRGGQWFLDDLTIVPRCWSKVFRPPCTDVSVVEFSELWSEKRHERPSSFKKAPYDVVRRSCSTGPVPDILCSTGLILRDR